MQTKVVDYCRESLQALHGCSTILYTFYHQHILPSIRHIFLSPCKTRIWHLAQIDHVEVTMGSISLRTYDNPIPSKITFNDLKRLFLPKSATISMSQGETRLHPPQGYSQIRIWFVLEATIYCHHHNARSLLLMARRIIDLPLELDDGGLSPIMPLLLLKCTWYWGILCVGVSPILLH